MVDPTARVGDLVRVRITESGPNSLGGTRLSRRAAGYLSTLTTFGSFGAAIVAFAVMLAAGLKGIEEGYELPPEAENTVWELSEAERRALGYKPLPSSLDRALGEHRDVHLWLPQAFIQPCHWLAFCSST